MCEHSSILGNSEAQLRRLHGFCSVLDLALQQQVFDWCNVRSSSPFSSGFLTIQIVKFFLLLQNTAAAFICLAQNSHTPIDVRLQTSLTSQFRPAHRHFHSIPEASYSLPFFSHGERLALTSTSKPHFITLFIKLIE